MSGKSLIFGPEDRDAQGRIAARSLADMLPPDTASPAPARPGSARARAAQLSAASLIGTAVLIALLVLVRPAGAPAGLPTAQPSAPAATAAQPAAAAATPTSAPAGCVFVQTTVAYYAPSGDPAPLAIERGAACTVVAWHSGMPDWRQIRVGSGAALWVPLAAISEQARPALNLAPPPTPTLVPATQTPIVIVREVLVAPAPCTDQNASYRTRRDPRGSEPPIGYSVAWSCESQADADSKAEALFQQLLKASKP